MALKIKFPKQFPYQETAKVSPQRLKVLCWGAQSGKTHFSMYAQAGFVLRASQILQVEKSDHLWVTRDGKFARDELHKAKQLVPDSLIAEFNRSDYFLRLKNGAKWWFYSGLEPDAFVGRSWQSAVFNEASTYSDTGWRRSVSPRLRGWAIFNFTPRGKRNWTYGLWNDARNNPGDYFHSQVASTENPTIDKRELELVRRINSEAYYRQEILAEFVDDAVQYFNPVASCWTGKFQPYKKDARYVAGLDWAQTRDYTAIAILRIDVLPRVLVFFQRFQHMQYVEQIAPLARKLKEYGNPPCYADSSEPTANQLMRAAGTNVEDFRFSAQSKPFICDQLRVGFEQGEIVMPCEQNAVSQEEKLQARWLRDEISAFEPHFVGGRLKLEARGQGHHDDILMALAQAWERARLAAPLHDEPSLAHLSRGGKGRSF